MGGGFLEIGRVFSDPLGGLQGVDGTQSHYVQVHVDDGALIKIVSTRFFGVLE
jgi:hypothetical protein